MNKIICLGKNYSTTKLLTKEKPVLEQRTEYKLKPKLFLPSNAERKGEGGLRIKGYFKKSYENKPLISIVTVVYNGEKHLEQTINSVLGQNYDNVEYIIIDGGSTDGTFEIIKKYEDAIDYWISEQDSGIYDAMNKGVSLCSGEYVTFLNADDWYNQDSVCHITDEIIVNRVDFLYGNLNFIKLDGRSQIWQGNSKNDGREIPHPTCFIKREVLLEVGFNMKLKIAADYDLILSLFSRDISKKYINKTIANFRAGGISELSFRTIYEDFLVTKNHLGLFTAWRNSKPKIASFFRGYLK